MYLARFLSAGGFTYQIRQSVQDHGYYVSHTLFDLGSEPGAYIVYPGGNAFYLDEDMVQAVEDCGRDVEYNDLEDLFWPFVHPRIRRAVGSFRERAKSKHRPRPLQAEDEEFIRTRVHMADKRRMNFLRLGAVDQSKLGVVPLKLYRPLLYASRDEIEQHFLGLEMDLKPHELATYVYSFLHLRRFFSEICAGNMPQGLDPETLDRVFEEQLCALNADPDFWAPESPPPDLSPYLVRYAIMFFDHPFGPSPFLEQILQDFMARHRFHQQPPQKQDMSKTEVSTLFEVPEATLLAMSKRQVTRLYRRLAKKYHPDQGGDQEMFIRLQQAYEWLLGRVKTR